MDRFKFRAWHSEQKRMIDIYGLGSDFATENTLDGVDPGTNAFMGDDFEKLTIMQSTGLKDKNGTLIYEGDIIKWGHLSGSYENPVRIAVVEIKPDIQFRLTNGKHTFIFGNFIYKATDKALEIIGNIYENAELLC
jgi:uncharacterized phage protein (TIGR01671 family)